VSVSVHLYVSPSTESYSDLNEIYFVGRGRRVIHDGMPSDPIQGQGQGQGHGGSKFAKVVVFKVYPLHLYACNQKTNGEL